MPTVAVRASVARKGLSNTSDFTWSMYQLRCIEPRRLPHGLSKVAAMPASCVRYSVTEGVSVT